MEYVYNSNNTEVEQVYNGNNTEEEHLFYSNNTVVEQLNKDNNTENKGRYVYKENSYTKYITIGCHFPNWVFNYTNDLNVKKMVDMEFLAINIEENYEISYGEEILLECTKEGKLQSEEEEKMDNFRSR